MESITPLRLREFAVAAAILGSVVPAWSVLELYRLPIGTALRPMHLGMQAFQFGLGVPLVVSVLVLAAFQSQDKQSRHSVSAWLLSIVAVALSLIPLILLIAGVRWVVNARGLIFEP